jgi:hypothetical protein
MPNITTLPAVQPAVPADPWSDPWSASAEADMAPRVRGEQLLPIDTSACGGGVIYLLHFDRPYRHARHYCGWTTNLSERLACHAIGRGARLLEVVAVEGIDWQLARTWVGDRRRERAIKNQGGLSRSCPICGVTPRGPRYAVTIPNFATTDVYSDGTVSVVIAGDAAGDPR